MKENDLRENKRILWIHNFKNAPGVGGGWMYNQYNYIKDEVDLYYLDNMRNPFRMISHIYNLRKLAKRYDIVHAQYGSAVGFLTSLISGCTRILSLKGSDWYLAPGSSFFDKIRIFFGHYMTKISLHRFDHIIVMSNKMRQEVLGKVPSAKVETIVDPIDLREFKPSENPIQNGIKKVLFASVDLDNPVKRYSLAKNSFDILQKRMPKTELVQMSKIPHAEVCDFMNHMDVILLTSVHEGWPNVVKEMMACNKPFVSTKVSDLEEYAAKTNNCFACDDSPEVLANALYKSLHAPSEDLRRWVIDFSMDKNMAVLKNIYNLYLRTT